MNKFNVNTNGIKEVGFFQVNGGKIHCTIDEFIDMHWLYEIEMKYSEEMKERILSFENEFLLSGNKFNFPKDEKNRYFSPMWEGEEFICYVDTVDNDIETMNEVETRVEETGFFIERWEENRFYPHCSRALSATGPEAGSAKLESITAWPC